MRGHLAEFGLVVAQSPAHVAKLVMAVQDKGLTTADLPQGRLDTAIGAALAAIAAVATLVAAAPLFVNNVDASKFASGADFATALRPLIGTTGATLFALGMIEAGAVAAMTISTSSAYAFGETARAPQPQSRFLAGTLVLRDGDRFDALRRCGRPHSGGAAPGDHVSAARLSQGSCSSGRSTPSTDSGPFMQSMCATPLEKSSICL
jgi:hypothetical protein